MEAIRSRMSNPVQLVPELNDASVAMFKAVSNGSVPRITIGLVGLRASQIAGNTYTIIRAARLLRSFGEAEDRIDALPSWQDAPYFTDTERAALALVEAVFQPSTTGERVPDQLFAKVVDHYDPKALATVAIAIGQASFWMPIALIGKPLPGRPPAETWA